MCRVPAGIAGHRIIARVCGFRPGRVRLIRRVGSRRHPAGRAARRVRVLARRRSTLRPAGRPAHGPLARGAGRLLRRRVFRPGRRLAQGRPPRVAGRHPRPGGVRRHVRRSGAGGSAGGRVLARPIILVVRPPRPGRAFLG